MNEREQDADHAAEEHASADEPDRPVQGDTTESLGKALEGEESDD